MLKSVPVGFGLKGCDAVLLCDLQLSIEVIQ